MGTFNQKTNCFAVGTTGPRTSEGQGQVCWAKVRADTTVKQIVRLIQKGAVTQMLRGSNYEQEIQ